jgi:hypothetical protein
MATETQARTRGSCSVSTGGRFESGARQEDEARQRAAILRHDIFNLVALAIVNSLNCWYLLYGKGVSTLIEPCSR